MALSSDLPEELLNIILSSLPAKSVIRFKCVCKSWYSLFQDPTFIAKHLINSENNNNIGGSLFHKRLNHEDYSTHTYSLLSYETLEVSANLDFPYLKDETLTCMRIVGCCDGIICIYYPFEAGVVLWNPATHEIKMLPPSLVPKFNNLSDTHRGPLGFGYDPKSNDYKVVHLVELNQPRLRHNYCQVEVYELRTDCWRKSDAFLPHSVRTNLLVPYVDGRFSWLGLNEFRCEIIVTFDLSDEIIIVTPLPEPCLCQETNYYLRTLTVLNDSVALINNPRIQRDYGISEVWVLSEPGVKESWTKLYTFGPVSELQQPSGFWKNGFMFIETVNWGVKLLNLCTLEMKDLHFDNSILNVFVYYKESLIRLNGCSCSDARIPRTLPPRC